MLTVEETSRVLGVSLSTGWRMLRRGQLRGVRRGGRRMIPRSSLTRASQPRQHEAPALTLEHPIFRLVGAGKSGGAKPGARDKHAILES